MLATGSTFNYFGHDEWQAIAPGIKTVEDATGIRARVLGAFEQAERETDAAARRAWLTFVIVGGGPSGVELAGSLSDVVRHTLRPEFRAIDPQTARILLVEMQQKLLAAYPDPLPLRAQEVLLKRGVEVRTGTTVTLIEPERVTLSAGGNCEEIACRTSIWTAGVKASPLGAALEHGCGAQLDRIGRVVVGPDLTLPGHPEIFVIGDLANFSHQDGKPLPGLAPVAMQQGAYVAQVIRDRLAGKSGRRAFHYHDKGTMAVIGRHAAVVAIWGLRWSGVLAWWLWLFVHLMYVVQFQNRVLVLVQWAWNYFTRNRSARLITNVRATTFRDEPCAQAHIADAQSASSAR